MSASAFAAVGEGKGHTVATEARRYADSSTELDVVRLTSAEHTAVLPPAWLRPVARRQAFLLYASDRGGIMQAWRMDLKTGESRQLTDAAALDPASLALSPEERSFFFFDGPSLKRSYFSSLRETEVYRVPAGLERQPDFALSEDGLYAAFCEKSGGAAKLQLLNIARRVPATLATHSSEMENPLFRPRRTQVLYRAEGGLWLVDFTGQNKRRLRTAEGGELGPARWSPSGRSILYLHYPGEHQLNTLRELTPDERTDKLIAKTSQFVQFGINGDASVFVGASRNTGSPYILLLLRLTEREMSLCEHGSSNPMTVNPMFSPDSQRVFFQSDRDGKPAIYRIRVEKFVEETDG